MQALYAHSMRPDQDVFVAENEMIHTIKNCYTLFLWFFSILPEVAYYRLNKLEDLKNKHNPTPEDLHPNTKFVDNEVIGQIENNETLKKLFPKYHINWSEDTDFIVKIFHQIEELDEYKAYMNNQEGNYEEDRKLVLTIIEKIFATDDHIRWFFGEKDPNWIDDYEEALGMLYKNIVDFKQRRATNVRF